MWYVVQVRTGTEENIKVQCQKNISDQIMDRCFVPYYEERKRICGEWSTIQKILFPGYLFLKASQVENLFTELKKIIGLTKILQTGDEMIPLTAGEICFLEQFGGEEQIVKMSEGIIENQQVKILSGPLQGQEGYIKKIDRHKRKAYLEMQMFGRAQRVEVGLEIVAKR